MGKIGAGGVIRSHDGSWVAGFYANLGSGSVLQSEAWGLLLGLKLAYDNQCSHLYVESDSETLINMVKNGVDEVHPLKTILNCCSFLQQKFLSFDIRHTYREVNAVADILSKDRLQAEAGVHVMLHPPPQVINSLLDDLCEFPRVRIVNSEV
ncbi:putative ribonuclease H-like domain-containing protein [Rosa chinensis]|uniref:Putative ribonuclease H-like domain-containing protein n=1 Tax=Rosa chinensis TaxID=74649 RepID=A0A2P6RGY9_ROSCH|nr:putative ribonuclease H-like domain-containing protein [Rosa chinensis]